MVGEVRDSGKTQGDSGTFWMQICNLLLRRRKTKPAPLKKARANRERVHRVEGIRLREKNGHLECAMTQSRVSWVSRGSRVGLAWVSSLFGPREGEDLIRGRWAEVGIVALDGGYRTVLVWG